MKPSFLPPISLSVSLLLFSAALLTSNIAPAAAQPAGPANLRSQAAELERRVAELNEAGRYDEALMLMRQLEELRAEIGPSRGRGRAEVQGDHRQPRPVRQPRAVREPQFERPDPAEIERRAHHLEIAIDNLRAADMHEPAERLTQHLERMRQHLADAASRRPERPQVPAEAIEELRAQIGGLHRVVTQLRAELEELRRERR
jgi:hypothetical protein